MSGSASSIFMCYGSLRGEAEVPPDVTTEPASGGWMKLTSCTVAAAIEYGVQFTSLTTGAANATPIQITKLTDASSTGLFREAILGAAPQKLAITFLRSGPAGPQEYMRIQAEECGIMDFSIESGGDERATEKFAIIFGRLSILSWEFDLDGVATSQAMVTIEHVS